MNAWNKGTRAWMLAAAALGTASVYAADDLSAGFMNPPAQARPHTWWHWMNGNVTKEGITADLEAMKKIGLGGAQIFNVSEDIPQGPIAYNSPEWRAMVKHAAAEADRLGLELCIHNCSGWSSSGGPWVAPRDAMQKVTISEVHVHGPAAAPKDLARPQTNNHFYLDIAVLAFPTPKDDKTRIDNISHKALYEYSYGLKPSGAALPADASIKKDSIVDITSHFKDNELDWQVPAGDWTILRIGHTPTGAVNAPSPVPGRGLEVDKLSREAFDHYWAGGMGPLIKELGPLAGKSLKNVLIDSYEVGCQNWSPKFREEFQKRRGYDPIVYLPVMTGRVVDSGDVSERFLWDMRRTIGDLFTENYYSYFAETCKKNGLLSSMEPYDGPFECEQVGRDADIVMGEFWVTGDARYSCKLASSVAHVFGKKIVGSESFTAAPHVGRWQNYPGSLKAIGDQIYCEGINRFIIHRYAHQPWLNVVPGMTMGQWGTHFERTTTWWEHGGPEWVQYLSRCQFLLQSGHSDADVLAFAGEDAPNGAPLLDELKASGYDYDSCGADVIKGASVHDGKIVLASGAAYRVLVLGESSFMTKELEDKLASLGKAGAVIIGGKPEHSPTLRNFPADDAAVKAGAEKLSVRSGVSAQQAMAEMKVGPDVSFAASSGKPTMAWIHRTVGDAEVYFVSNQKPRGENLTCSFRVSGKTPELWNAEAGTIEPAPAWTTHDGRTDVMLHLDQAGSVFVVFRDGKAGHIASVRGPEELAAKPPKIEVQSARYEAIDGAGAVNVTAKVQAMVAQGQDEVAATNGNFGDPTYNHAKRLHVEYTIDGKAITRDVAENDVLAFVKPGPDAPPSFRVAMTTAGVELRAFKAGDYEVKSADGSAKKVSVANLPASVELTGPWSVSFQAGRGAPAHADFPTLASWTASSDAGVKYFSGTATYEKDFDIPAAMLGGQGQAARPVELNLGSVGCIAEVSLNGKPLRTLWKPPFVEDITGIAVAGKNHLTVKVTNLWINRLIGDEQLPEDTQWARPVPTPLKAWPEWFAQQSNNANASLADRPEKGRLTFTTWKHWQKDSPLEESGLMGPVTVRAGERKEISSGK